MVKVDCKTILYIVSDVRSGSTLLENILSKSNEVVSVGELHHLDSHLHKGKWGSSWNWKCSCGESFDSCKFWTNVFKDMNVLDFDDIKNTEVKYEKLSGAVEESKRQATLELLDRIYTSVFNTTGVKVVVDSSKRPLQGKAIYENSSFNVKILYLKRDLRAVVISKNKWSMKFYDKSLDLYKVLWSSYKHRINCKKVLREVRDEDLYVINYEHMLSDLQFNLDSISSFVGFSTFRVPEYTVLDNDHTIGGTPGRFEKRKIKLDSQWKKTAKKKPIFNTIGFILNKLS